MDFQIELYEEKLLQLDFFNLKTPSYAVISARFSYIATNGVYLS